MLKFPENFSAEDRFVKTDEKNYVYLQQTVFIIIPLIWGANSQA